MKLREYQAQAIDNIREAFRKGHKRVCFQLPTGGGKTILAAFMIKGAVERGKRVLFLVHLKELIKQTSSKLLDVGVSHAYIAPGADYVESAPVQIAMVQTLKRRLDVIQWKPDLIISDECHHSASSTYKTIFDKYPEAIHVGLSATPERLDGKGLDSVYSAIVNGPKVRELIEAKHLSDYRLYGVPSDLDLSDVHTLAGDYKKDELEEAIRKSSIIGDAVAYYKRLLSGRKALVFCTSIKHSLETAERFNAAGTPAAHIDGSMSQAERDSIIEAFKAGRIKVLVNCSLVSEGFDVPDCDGVIMLRPTQSLTLYLQAIGRALRPQENKTAIIIDHVGNYLRHGLPDDDREWSLEGRKKKRKGEKINIRTCESCFAVYSSKLKYCPQCNSIPKKKERREIEEMDGQLEEIDKSKFNARNQSRSARTLPELVALGKQLGYKSGWAHHVWQARLRKQNG